MGTNKYLMTIKKYLKVRKFKIHDEKNIRRKVETLNVLKIHIKGEKVYLWRNFSKIVLKRFEQFFQTFRSLLRKQIAKIPDPNKHLIFTRKELQKMISRK